MQNTVLTILGASLIVASTVQLPRLLSAILTK
jgi:hypothetical protein